MQAVIYAAFLFNIIFAGLAYWYFSGRGFATALLWLCIMMYFIIGLLDYGNAAAIFSQPTIATALLFAAFGSVLFFLSLYFICAVGAQVAGVTLGVGATGLPVAELRRASGWLKWLFLPLLLSIPITLVLVFGPDTFQQTWQERRLVDSKFAILPTMLVETLTIFPGIFWLSKERVWAVASLVVVIALSVLSGSRLSAVIAMASIYVALIASYGPRRWLRLLPLLALPAAMALHVFLRLTRDIDANDLVVALFDGTILDLLSNAASSGVDIFGGERAPFRGFYYVVESEIWKTFPDVLQTIQRILFVWLPHEISHKPVDVVDLIWQRSLDDGYMAYMVSTDASSDADKYEMLMRLVAQGSMHCTLWGEALANGGYVAAVPVLLFLALLFAVQETGVAATPPVARFGLMALMIAQFMYVARGNTVTGFTHFLFVGTIWCAIAFAINHPLFGRSRSRAPSGA